MLARLTGVDEAELRDTVARHEREPRYRPIALIADASTRRSPASWRGGSNADLLVEQVPTREYPVDDLAAHIFGYVGEVTEQQLARTEFTGLHSGASSDSPAWSRPTTSC